MQPRVLVFDLAGVLLDFRGVESLHALSDGRIGVDAFGRFWSHSPWADALYCGRCSPDAFAAGAVDEFALSVSPAEFLTAFRAWLQGPYTGAFELLRGLRPRYQLACLSNTNELDVVRFREELQLDDVFDRCFFSNEIGLRKPDAACYRHVVDALGVRAEDVLFFDDSRECIEGAREAGLQAYQTVGLHALRATLRRVGVLSN
jgi:putative hydrolase of the HAD superfamily